MLSKIDRNLLSFAVSLYIPGFFINLGWGIVSPILPIYAESFGVPYALVAMVTTANALGRLAFDIPLGAICDRVGRRPLSVGGPLLVTLFALLSGIAQNFYELLFYRAMTGCAMSMWMIARQALIADSIDRSIRGRILSTFQGVNMIGSAAGPAVGGIIAEIWGMRAPFFFYAASTFVSLIACLLLVRETSQKNRSTAENRRTGLRQVLGFLTFPILAAAFTNFANHIRFSARGVLVPLYGHDILGMSSGEIGLVLSISTLANVLMVVPGGYVVDKFGRKAALVPAFVLTGLVFALFPFATDFVSVASVSFMLGVASGIGGGATMTVAADLSPENQRGFFLGFWQTVGDLGSAVGPVALGIIADLQGLITPFYATAILMLFTAAITQLFVKETLEK